MMGNAVRWLGFLGLLIGSSSALASVEVQGTVTFRRHLSQCGQMAHLSSASCAEAVPFWTTFLCSERECFHLQTPFGVGSPVPPVSVIIGRAAVASGDVIRARATVASRGHDAQFLERVESVFVLDHGRGSPVMPSSPFGWSCHSVSSSPMNIHASVFEVSPNSYQLRVLAVQGDPAEPVLYPLLRLQDVRAEFDQDRRIYRGENGSVRAELTIREIEGELHLPASLKLVRSEALPDDPLGPVSETAMVCTPTRQIDP